MYFVHVLIAFHPNLLIVLQMLEVSGGQLFMAMNLVDRSEVVPKILWDTVSPVRTDFSPERRQTSTGAGSGA
jgi:hypothetical protein